MATVVASVVASALLLGVAAVAGRGLLGSGGEGLAPARPLSTMEAERLATMRWHNWRDQHTGVRATISGPEGSIALTGWLDWQHPVVYLARSDLSGEPAELIQAVPGLVAVRPAPTGPPYPPGTDDPTSSAGPQAPARPVPPTPPPADGWRLRTPGAPGPLGTPDEPGTLDSLLFLLLSLAAPELDSAPTLAGSDAQWLRRDQLAGTELDVLLGPAVMPSTEAVAEATTLADMGGAVQYWIDPAGRLHRFQALLTERSTVEVDLDRTDQTSTPVLAVLGGAAVDPRPVTDAEAQLLAQLRVRNFNTGGGEVTVRLPAAAGGRVRATGWLDWQRPVAYLAVYRDGAPDGLIWADTQGVSTRGDHPPRRGLPPLPAPPPDGGWHWQPWDERAGHHGGHDLDLLINEVLAASFWYPDEPAAFAEQAVWLRRDTLAETEVSVYELPRPDEATLPAGAARLRYWVAEETGALLRLEVRTRSGGFGQLDITPGPLPYLG